MSADPTATKPTNFIRQIIDEDNRTGKWGGRVHTRFPPEPNGYLHIGHAKSICLNYGLARDYGGKFNLRFDDTNPTKEEVEYVESIKHDVKWLGGDYDSGPHGGGLYFASDYFERMYDFAVELIRKGCAYVCDLTAAQVSEQRGVPPKPGVNSPFRDRPVEENLDLFRRMRDGEFPDGTRTLRAKIDMASGNVNLRDPVMYRISHAHHHNTGDRWKIYPMYDWAHGLEDSVEGITHSICTLEFEDHRPLYDWFIDAINKGRTPDGSGEWGKRIHHPQQIEFARLSVSYTVTSKRKLLQLVKDGHVRGWDDPRMPTIAAFRRRGYTPEAIRAFADETGATKFKSVIDVGRLENAIREDLNKRADRRMGVLRPLKVVIENWPKGHVELVTCVNNPENPEAGTREVPFSGTLYIERDDFMENPPSKFFRLSPGREVRLRYAYFVTCTGVEKDASGEVTAVRCTYDPATKGGDSPDGRKVKATMHWVSAEHAVAAEVRLFDRLFAHEAPDRAGDDVLQFLNPNSLEVIANAMLEPSLGKATLGDRFQFERLGYFCIDPDSKAGAQVFNRTVTLKDTWAKVAGKGP